MVSLKKGRRVISSKDPVYISDSTYSILIDNFIAWSGNYFLSLNNYKIQRSSLSHVMFTWFNFKLKICFGSRATFYLFMM